MNGRKNRAIMVCLMVFLFFITIQFLPSENFGQDDFTGGLDLAPCSSNISSTSGTVPGPPPSARGDADQGFKTEYVEDEFKDESKIAHKKYLTVDTAAGEVKLIKSSTFFRTYTGLPMGDDKGYSVQQTSDGGFIIAGETETSLNKSDYWLLKTNEMGIIQWHQNFGGLYKDWCNSVIQTADGGFITVGVTDTFAGNREDAFVVKTDNSGKVKWQRSYGGLMDDGAESIVQTPDGGYIIVGHTYSTGNGESDVWIFKVNNSGLVQWEKTFGGKYYELGNAIIPASGGGYIIVGHTDSFIDLGSGILLIKINSTGDVEWNEIYVGGGGIGHEVQSTPDGGYIIVGELMKSGYYGKDIALIKTDGSGEDQWSKRFGGRKNDRGFSISQTQDGGYILVGETYSHGAGYNDIWLIKTNNTGEIEWDRCIGGAKNDTGYEIQVLSDDGYVIVGASDSYGNGSYDLTLIRTNKFGNSIGENVLVSKNLLEGQLVHSVNAFNYTATIPAGTSIRIQFSFNNNSWYNSTGALNGWDSLSNGINSINLSAVANTWTNFYYKVTFSSVTMNSPVLKNINVSYNGLPKPDLLISEIAMNKDNNTVLTNEFFELRVMVYNSGDGVATNFTVAFWDGPPEEYKHPFRSQEIKILQPNRYANVTFEYIFYDGGYNRIYIIVDPDDVVAEQNE
ncbi:CARDB domain-containing protein, partial [[Eubacterium] cellulosolvens]